MNAEVREKVGRLNRMKVRVICLEVAVKKLD